jgi:hypothetical protein
MTSRRSCSASGSSDSNGRLTNLDTALEFEIDALEQSALLFQRTLERGRI